MRKMLMNPALLFVQVGSDPGTRCEPGGRRLALGAYLGTADEACLVHSTVHDGYRDSYDCRDADRPMMP